MPQPYILNKINLSEAALKVACNYGQRHVTDINTQATGTEYLMDVTVYQKTGAKDPIGSFVLIISEGSTKIEVDEDDTIVSFDGVITKIREAISPSELHVI